MRRAGASFGRSKKVGKNRFDHMARPLLQSSMLSKKTPRARRGFPTS